MPTELSEAFLFSQLDEGQLERVRKMSSEIRLQDNEALFEVGDEARRFFLVQEGQIKLSRLSMNGNEKVIEVVTAGYTFAEALMFSDKPSYPVRATSIGKSRLIAVDSRGFLDLLRESTDTCFRVMGDMSMRLRRMIKEIDDLTLQSATGRVAGYLCGKSMLKGQTRVAFELATPKGVLASRLSVKPETFSRILHNFTDQGLVKVRGGHIEILDVEGLRKHAESSGVCGQQIGPES
ncbi:Crp/Fnr family transcriptional regulator [Sedimenticola hydrogenitrophicus]|jgi:CRP-like cAMP-binding protein|uniref:Crp/Fnr family transcriptional regulator n=1 Tax=Sedimenticola hydrogenitrophicus TaxID=2967975 RepID=UPI0023B18562|nr:Crp/Fnr family transcriptional regulator [Sedimenticola hydrogenitrophicus]